MNTLRGRSLDFGEHHPNRDSQPSQDADNGNLAQSQPDLCLIHITEYEEGVNCKVAVIISIQPFQSVG